MENKNNQIAILEGLGKVPPDSRVLLINTPIVWLFYIEVSPSHYYYIEIEKKMDNDEKNTI